MKNLKIVVIGLTIIFFFMLSSFAVASNTLSYNVKTGDKQSYKISKYMLLGYSVSYETFTLTDGSKEQITWQAGFSYSVKVCNTTTTSTGQTLYTQFIFGSKTVQCASLYFPDSLLIRPVTSNTSYYSDLVSQNSSLYQLNGNNFTEISIKTYTYSNLTDYTSVSYDITTGWATQLNWTSKYTNGTVLDELLVNGTPSSGKSPGFEVSSLLISFTIIVPVVLIYRKRKTI